MKKNKIAQSISINTIVIAAIGLIVLVVMIAVFGGRIKIFSSGAQDCETQGGTCEADCSDVGEPGDVYTALPGTDCEPPEDKCCIPIIESPQE
jgi:hypothetical protein